MRTISLRSAQCKFVTFMKSINVMDLLFSSSFSPLEDSGSAFTRCGQTRKYLQYIEGPPKRLYNKYTESVYKLPLGGSIKQSSGKSCPVCNFELCLYSVGSPLRTFPLCPFCYNNPKEEWGGGGEDLLTEAENPSDPKSYESLKKAAAGVASRRFVLGAPHADLHPIIEQITCAPDDSGEGVLILDLSTKQPKLVGTKTTTIIHFDKSVKSVRVLDSRDPVIRECRQIEVEFKPGEEPEEMDGDLIRVGSLIGDDLLLSMTRKQVGEERSKPRGSRGGRGGRGGRRENQRAIQRTEKEKVADEQT